MDDEIWTTKEGRRLKVSEMSEDHVRAVLRMLIRRARERAAIRAHLEQLEKQLQEDWDQEMLLALHDD